MKSCAYTMLRWLWVLAQVTSPCELEQCDEETLAAILGTDAKVLPFAVGAHRECKFTCKLCTHATARQAARHAVLLAIL